MGNNFIRYLLQSYPQVYIPKRRTLILVLLPANAYSKLFATCSCIFTNPIVAHSCIYAIRPVCVHCGVCNECLISNLRQNEYMHEQITKEFEGQKYLYKCTPFGYVLEPPVCTGKYYIIILLLYYYFQALERCPCRKKTLQLIGLMSGCVL